MEHLVNILRGVAQALELVPSSRGYRVEKFGHVIDAQRLRGDFETIGQDLRAQLKNESSNYRSR